MKRFTGFLLAFFLLTAAFGQSREEQAYRWADSVLATLSRDQRMAQLLIIRAHSNLGPAHVQQVAELVRRYNVGGLCFFQGGPVRQAQLTNYYQRLAQTPLLITIDGEWGLGMRLDSVRSLPRQLMLGAVNDAALAYEYGKILGEQCRRMGIHVNFSPVADVNNNPNNPVINDRSFGEDKFKVSLFGVQLTRGMQEQGVMACAKHFPGHGDTEVDSHYDLPVITKTRPELDSLELHPFRELFTAGVGSVMVGHLYIPAIDNTRNRATSLSYNNVTRLLREELQFKGLVFTDALEMQGVKKFFPDGAAGVEALLAGNDLLCLPADVPATLARIRKAVRKKQLSMDDINERVRRVLVAKFLYGAAGQQPVDTNNLVADLNANTSAFERKLATEAITLVRNRDLVFPINASALSFLAKNRKEPLRVAYVAIGASAGNAITQRMRKELGADVFFFPYTRDAGTVPTLIELLENNYHHVLVGLHGYSRRPANQYGIRQPALQLAQALAALPRSALLLFGNPYAARYFCSANNLLVCYEDSEPVQQAAFDILTGVLPPQGTLPVTVCDNLPFGTSLTYPRSATSLLPRTFLEADRFAEVDSLVEDAIRQRAFPGCVVLAAKDGQVVFEKAYGHFTYERTEPVQTDAVYDLASVTKICATTVAVMKLYDEGKLDLKERLGTYLPWVRGTNKENLMLEDILLHQAGLKSWIPFFREVTDEKTGVPDRRLFRETPADAFSVAVAERLFMRTDWLDTLKRRILQSELTERGKYVYSDNDFIFLGNIVEQLTGLSLDAYVRRTFYEPLHLHGTGFLPRNHLPWNRLVPTEREPAFRRQLLRGFVHDPGAAMMGGVAGHAGLFGTAYDLAVLMQLLANGGSIGGQQFFRPETVRLFTSYGSENSRRGLGFDKPEKDNPTRKEPYPAVLVSPATFGHTGFTGTCTWADPDNGIVFVFLSNRVHPDFGNNKLLTLNVRGKVQDALYRALLPQKDL
ncbi:MAG TPA: glycoside hydrolase family 3 N-terminal domain-containing protein [Lacibacter sp.]|nr:glycoside hydrolase family 3 N-terminal domain-containing protein [Lacibacter sp.]HMO88620.1 glycoside hydrolase family 3 N-terminal domain-containing protein [Lacibacter sp.]